MRLARTAVLAAAITVPAALPASAAALTFCVNDAPCVAAGGQAQGTISDAFSAAQFNPGHDRVQIGPGTYTGAGGGGFTYSSAAQSNSVDVVGAGPDQTLLTGPVSGGGGYTTLKIGSSLLSTVRNLKVTARPLGGIADFNVALAMTGTVRGVLAEVGLHQTGILLEGGSAAEDSRVVQTSGDGTSPGIHAKGPGTRVDRSRVEAKNLGIQAGSGASLVVSRSSVSGGTAVNAQGGTATIESSVLTAEPGTTFFRGVSAISSGVMRARHITIDGKGIANSEGAQAVSTAASDDSEVFVDGSAIGGVTNSLHRLSTNGIANVTARFSNYDPATAKSTGAGSGAVTHGPGNVNVPPGFVDGAAGDYRMRADSPMLDLADPAPDPPLPPEDFDGGTRAADGNGDGGSQPDMGALEFVSQPPQAAIQGPDAPAAGEPASFSGSASSDPDPGDALTYSWSADGGGLAKLLRSAAVAAQGPDLTLTFPTPGSASLVLTVRDRAGLTASVLKPVSVLDKAAPVVSKLKASNRSFAVGPQATPLTVAAVKRGTTFTLSLSEAATVTVRIERRLAGRLVGSKCSTKAKTGTRCTVYKRAGTLTRAGRNGKNSVGFSGRLARKALAPGAYRAVVAATDAAGNTSAAKTVSFRVVAS